MNNVCSVAQAKRLAPRVDMLGVRIGPRDEPPYVTVATAIAIREAVTTPLAASCDDVADLARVGATHYDFVPVDYAKVDAFEREIARLHDIALPKVALGFFVLEDDRGFIAEREPFERLRDAGVELFQLEVGPNTAEQAASFCEHVACLTSGEPVRGARGTYFDLPSGDAGMSEANVIRALRAMQR